MCSSSQQKSVSVHVCYDECITYIYLIIGKKTKDIVERDRVNTYASEVLSLGMVWHHYYDAIKEGDGDRVMRIWKYLMVIFKETGHRNYAKEAALLLINYMFMSSERVALQVMTSRFVNTKGRPGCNIPCDLHMEHLNRRLKGIITRMESNVKPGSLQRAARAIGVVEEICLSFGKEMGAKKDSDKHAKPSYEKDFKWIRDVLQEKQIFEHIPKRRHAFIAMNECVLQGVDNEKIADWVIEYIIPNFM